MSSSSLLHESATGQSIYYDAPEMRSPHQTGEGDSPRGENDLRLRSYHPHSTDPSDAGQPSRTEETGSPSKRVDNGGEQKPPSLRSLPIEPEGQEKYLSGLKATLGRMNSALGRKDSVRTTRSTRTAASTSAFANGGPLSGPDAEPDVDESILARGARAERSLTEKQKDRIAKEEREESRRFSKLLKTESTTEKVALDSALKNLSSLQSLHKTAIRREAKAEASHAGALSAAQKAESRYQEEKARTAEWRARAEARCMEERARWEGKQGEVRAHQERLESARETVREMEARIAECAREVERLRIVKATDEREREARLTEMTAK